MSLEKNKTFVRGFIEAYNERKLDLFDDFVSLDYVDHSNNVFSSKWVLSKSQKKESNSSQMKDRRK